jgi:hypothetical protein
MANSDGRTCDRPGCYAPSRPRSRFCSNDCRRAVTNVERRERRQRERAQTDSGFGGFRFICVEGDMDCRYGTRDGLPLVEFSWNGCDENDPACGRGWAVVVGDDIRGRIYNHRGDDSAFAAERKPLDPDVTRSRARALSACGSR